MCLYKESKILSHPRTKFAPLGAVWPCCAHTISFIHSPKHAARVRLVPTLSTGDSALSRAGGPGPVELTLWQDEGR